ncbi:laminin subunit beta-1-like [Anopheles marshallii]|uniref:laminin subunit beta-1-like n=1 Tax=Anopheles marshallii TaxID=1521116 RepID=UPI00237B166E|nr:laminin subunit beta-1-like [Anopheles marshallii]
MKILLNKGPEQCGVLSVLLVLLITSQVCSLQGDNVCYRYESYAETETIPRNQTVQVLTRQWCLEIPPRCTSYRTEIKEVFVKQNVTKTRRVEFCCEGYQERRTGNGTSGECRPICRGGCIHGECTAPNVCSCEAGFGGKYCLQRCRNGTWGVNCRNRCHCQNFAHCDTKTGHCRCTEGWMGKYCETPCAAGYFGTMCVSKCSCSTRSCHPQTGICMPDDEIVMFDNITRTVENSFSSESTERISAEQWIKVENLTHSTTSSTTTDNANITKTTFSTASTFSEIPTSSTTEAAGQMLPNATYAESYHEYLPNNTEMSMVLTKGHSRTASNESMYELVTTTSRVEITFIDTAVKKIEDHSTVNNATDEEEELLSISNDTANDTDTQLVYLESENHPVLVDISGEGTAHSEANDRQAFVTISCLLITLALLISVVFYMKRLNRKTLAKPAPSTPPPVKIVDESVQTGSDSNRSSDPLPDLPHVTYTRVKPKLQRNGDIEHYDVPANNSFIHRAKSSPYNYNFTINQKHPPRKYSLEHIYDEIQYPPLAEAANGTTQPDKPSEDQLDEKDESYSKQIVLT